MNIQNSILISCLNILFFLFCLSPVVLPAQSLMNVLQQSKQIIYFSDRLDNAKNMYPVIKENTPSKRNHSVMIPKPGQYHTAPLFCRLEDKINKGNKLQCLFRLGSVSYVNYLERKGDHQRLMLEQLQ